MTRKAMLMTGAVALAVAAGTAWAAPRDGQGMDRADAFNRMLERIDTDGDGAITQAERDAHAQARFAEADADGDGLLSVDEALAAAEARRAQHRADRAAAMVARLDRDGDGMLSATEAMAGGPSARLFDRLDRDADGTISADELDRVRDRMARRDGHRGGGMRHGLWHDD